MRHARGGKSPVRFIAHHASVAEQGGVGYARAFRGKVMRKHIFGVHPYPFVKGGRMLRRYGDFRQHFRCVISQPVFILRCSYAVLIHRVVAQFTQKKHLAACRYLFVVFNGVRQRYFYFPRHVFPVYLTVSQHIFRVRHYSGHGHRLVVYVMAVIRLNVDVHKANAQHGEQKKQRDRGRIIFEENQQKNAGGGDD